MVWIEGPYPEPMHPYVISNTTKLSGGNYGLIVKLPEATQDDKKGCYAKAKNPMVRTDKKLQRGF